MPWLTESGCALMEPVTVNMKHGTHKSSPVAAEALELGTAVSPDMCVRRQTASQRQRRSKTSGGGGRGGDNGRGNCFQGRGRGRGLGAKLPGGLTLVEVMVGLALLAFLASALLVAHGRQVRQWRRAQLRHEAVRALDEQMARWWTGQIEGVEANDVGRLPDGRVMAQGIWAIPRAGEGRLAERLVWRSFGVVNDNAKRLGAEVVRIEVLERPSDGNVVDDVEPVLILDLLAPLRREDESSPTSVALSGEVKQ